jgi:hypothetical protein
MSRPVGAWLREKATARAAAQRPFVPHKMYRIEVTEGIYAYECKCGMQLFQLKSVILASYRQCPGVDGEMKSEHQPSAVDSDPIDGGSKRRVVW